MKGRGERKMGIDFNEIIKRYEEIETMAVEKIAPINDEISKLQHKIKELEKSIGFIEEEKKEMQRELIGISEYDMITVNSLITFFCKMNNLQNSDVISSGKKKKKK